MYSIPVKSFKRHYIWLLTPRPTLPLINKPNAAWTFAAHMDQWRILEVFRAVPLLLLGCGREPPALPRKSWDLIRILLEFTGSKERGSPSTAVTHREERRGEEALTWSCELWQGGGWVGGGICMGRWTCWVGGGTIDSQASLSSADESGAIPSDICLTRVPSHSSLITA